GSYGIAAGTAPTDNIVTTVKTGTGNDSIFIEAGGSASAMYRAEITDTGGNNWISVLGGNGLEFSDIKLTGKGNDTVSITADGAATAIGYLDPDVGYNDWRLFPHHGDLDTVTNHYMFTGTGLVGGNITFAGGDNELRLKGSHAGAMGRIVEVTPKNGAAYDSIAAYADIKLNGNGDNLVDISGGNFGVYGAKLSLGTGNDTVLISAGENAAPLTYGMAMAHSSLSITGGVNLVSLSSGAEYGIGAYNSTLSLGGETTLAVSAGGDRVSGIRHSSVAFTGKGDARLEVESGAGAVSNSTVTAGGNLSAALRGNQAIFVSSLSVNGAADLLVEGVFSGIDGSTVTLKGTGNRLSLTAEGYGVEESHITSKGGDVIDITSKTKEGFLESSLVIDGGDNLLSVKAGTEAAENSSLSFGGGNDTVILKGGTAALLDAHLATGAGNDLIELQGTVTGNYDTTVKNKPVTRNAIDAGNGDDTIQVVAGAAPLFTAGAVVDGGAGTDVLCFTGATPGTTLNLGGQFADGAKVNNVEVIHIGDNVSTLHLNAAGLANFTPAAFKVPGITGNLTAMRITGDDGAALSFYGSGWETDAQLYRLNGEYYYLFTNKDANPATSVLVSAALNIEDGTYTNTGEYDMVIIPNGVSLDDMAAVSGAKTIYDFGDAAQVMTLNAAGVPDVLLDTGLSFGKGNDNITLVGSNGQTAMKNGYIDLGEGNNTLTFANAKGETMSSAIGDYYGSTAIIRAGAGNDTLIVDRALGDGVVNAHIDLGDGNNKVQVAAPVGPDVLAASTISLGKGNDTVILDGLVYNSTINLGDGDNRFTAGGFWDAPSALVAGNGADSIIISRYAESLTLDAGEGKNTISVGEYLGDSFIRTGSGNDLVTVGGLMKDSAIELHDGNNTLSVGSLENAEVFAGSGADQVSVGAMSGATEVYLGAGNDTLFLTGNVAAAGSTVHLDGAEGAHDVLDLSRYQDKIFRVSAALADAKIEGFEVVSLKDGLAGAMQIAAADLAKFENGDLEAGMLTKVTAGNGKDKTANAALLAELKGEDVLPTLMRIDGDAGKDVVYLKDNDWSAVGSVTVGKAVYQVWYHDAAGSEQYVLIQNGLEVRPGEGIPEGDSRSFSSVGAEHVLSQALTESHYLGNNTEAAKYVITGSEGNDSIYIAGELKDKSSFNLGCGNDTLLISQSFTSGTITTGNMGNHFILLNGGAEKTNITLAGANDRLHAAYLDGGKITGTGGAANITAAGLYGVTANLGGGNDTVDVGELIGGKLTMGEGHNRLMVAYAEKANVSAGSGNDSITCSDSWESSTVSLGAGNNKMEAFSILDGSVSAGDGDDTLAVEESLSGVKVELGAGNNVITVEAAEEWMTPVYKGSITAKGGDDYLRVGGTVMGTKISLGDGDNRVLIGYDPGETAQNGQMDGVSLTTGSGDDYVAVSGSIYGRSTVALGAGDNTLAVGQSLYDSKVTAGAGNDMLEAWGITNSTIDLGAGDDFVKIGDAITGGSLVTGAGDDTVVIGGRMYGKAGISLGAGNDLVAVDYGSFALDTGCKLDGGAGTDTLALRGEIAPYDLGAIAGGGTITGMDVINLGTMGTNESVILSVTGDALAKFTADKLAGVVSLSGGPAINGQSIMRVDGDNSDHVDLAPGEGWGIVGLYEVGGKVYNLYQNLDGKKLLVEANVDVSDCVAFTTATVASGGTYDGNWSGEAVTLGSLTKATATFQDQWDYLRVTGKVTDSVIDLGNGHNAADIKNAFSKSEITAGGGNDTLTLRGAVSGADVNLGDGYNSVSLYGALTGAAASLNVIRTGEHGDKLQAWNTVKWTDIDLGDGDNRAMFRKDVANSTVRTGAGNDSLAFEGKFTDGVLDMGGGSDTVSIMGAVSGAGITGEGFLSIDIAGNMTKSSITQTGDGGSSMGFAAVDGSTITLGDGVNVFRAGATSGSTIRFGSGDDDVYVASLKGGKLTLGAGDDYLRVDGNVSDKALIELGAGTSEVSVDGSVTNSTITATGEAGDDGIYVNRDLTGSKVDLGAGDDYLSVDGNVTNSTLTFGAGYDDLAIYGNLKNSTIELGDDGSWVYIGEKMESGSITGGDGGDTVSIWTMAGGKVDLGAGDDILRLDCFSSKSTGTIDGGAGDMDVLSLNLYGESMKVFANNGSFAGLFKTGAVTNFENLMLEMTDWSKETLEISAADIQKLKGLQGVTDLLVKGDTLGETGEFSDTVVLEGFQTSGESNKLVDGIEYVEYTNGTDAIWVQLGLDIVTTTG
ncbi:hypothetical protein LJC26_07725, partial [Desulfovibrio sp. OttesenSCG-928-O18]|nr:hypothetical protein [Desulfovibrio sp. OttesenSCG-928-O18]